MKKVHDLIYICDNQIFLKNLKRNKIYQEKLTSLKEDYIIDSNLFNKEFFKFLAKNHIKESLFGRNVIVIINVTNNFMTIEKFKEILSECYRKIEIMSLENILKLDNDSAYLSINKDYIDLIYMKKNDKKNIRINLNLFHDNLNKAIQYIINNIYKPNKMMILGSYENISKVSEMINNKYNILTTFPEKYYCYIFDNYN